MFQDCGLLVLVRVVIALNLDVLTDVECCNLLVLVDIIDDLKVPQEEKRRKNLNVVCAKK